MKIVNRFILISSLLIIALITFYGSVATYIAHRAHIDTKIESDAIVVLGARSYINGKYNPCLKARVDHAVKLYKDGYAPKILFTGGNDIEDNVNEAETMKKIAMDSGIKEQDVLLEKNATSTFENFINSQQILKENNLTSVIIVTEPFHIARASLVADKLGFNYTTSPAENSSCWQPNKYFTKYFLKEPAAIIQYKLQGKI